MCRVFASFYFFLFLHCLLQQLVLSFSFVFSSQINSGSFKSELLLEISLETSFWIVNPFSIGLNLLVTFSHEIDYQPVLMALTLMSMLNARTGYPEGTPDQLCCFGHFDPNYCPSPLLLGSFDWSAHPLLRDDM